MTKFKITKDEITKRIGYVLLGLSAGLFLEEIKGWLVSTFNASPIIIGIIGFVLVLYFFDFS